jgi:hypothetical protein
VSDLFVALVHHPVVDRNGQIVTSAITSLDIHDLARAARTYDVRAVYIVHPIPEQRKFAASVIDHWRFDYGRTHDSRRREALEGQIEKKEAERAALAEQMNDPDFYIKRQDADDLIAGYDRLGREIEELYAQLLKFDEARAPG